MELPSDVSPMVENAVEVLVDELPVENDFVDMLELPNEEHSSDEESRTSAEHDRVGIVALRCSKCMAHIRMALCTISSSGIVFWHHPQ